ncbi:MAG: YitT family protein [Bacteroidetes bacterium]|nr:YitT family protein [Bacteroidota bacterium]
MKNSKAEILNYIFIVLGSFFLAFGVAGFLSPNNIATGGTAGLAIVLHHVVKLPIGVLMALINIPLLLVSLKYLGKKFAIKSIVCIFFIVVFVDFLSEVIHLPNFSKDLLLATLYGGVIIGIGLGLIFKGGASAGGGTILAKIVASKTDIKTSTVVLILDALVVASAGFVFRSIELALWSLISIYVASKLIDTILIGAHNQKIVHISSSKNLNELSRLISESLGISGTVVNGNSLGATENKDIIFIMIDKNRVNALKQIVAAYDENVKMIVMEATEILGKESATI